MNFGGFFGQEVMTELPVEEAGLTDLGTVVLRDEENREERRYTLQFADGEPVLGDEIRWGVVRVDAGRVDGEGGAVDEEGAFLVSERGHPFLLCVEGPRLYPMAIELRPEGPSEIRLPAGALTGVLRGADGKSVPGVVYVDSARYDCPDGRFSIRGIPGGPHIVIAGARDYVGEVRRIVLEEGETRDVAFDLVRR